MFFAILSFYFLTRVKLPLAFLFFVIAVCLDFIDGAIARLTGKVTKKGAYLDTIADRYVEAITLLGFLFLPLPRIPFPSEIWVFIALFGSLMTTYAKAAAKEKKLIHLELKKGLIERAERVLLIALIILSAHFSFYFATYILILLAILSNLTALQRIYFILGQGGE
jgi:phosphatidylglycerophosphate synthase